MSAATKRAVAEVSEAVDEAVSGLSVHEYRDVLEELIDDLQMRLSAAEHDEDES